MRSGGRAKFGCAAKAPRPLACQGRPSCPRASTKRHLGHQRMRRAPGTQAQSAASALAAFFASVQRPGSTPPQRPRPSKNASNLCMSQSSGYASPARKAQASCSATICRSLGASRSSLAHSNATRSRQRFTRPKFQAPEKGMSHRL